MLWPLPSRRFMDAPMFGSKLWHRGTRAALPDEALRILGLPSWEDRVATVAARVMATRRQTERDRLGRLAARQGNYLPDDRMTRAEVAAYLRMSIRNVQRHEQRGKLQPAPRFGREVVYYFRDVRRFASAIRKER
jgi:hypothetical protein